MGKNSSFLALSVGSGQNCKFPCTFRSAKSKVSIKPQADDTVRTNLLERWVGFMQGKLAFCPRGIRSARKLEVLAICKESCSFGHPRHPRRPSPPPSRTRPEVRETPREPSPLHNRATNVGGLRLLSGKAAILTIVLPRRINFPEFDATPSPAGLHQRARPKNRAGPGGEPGPRKGRANWVVPTVVLEYLGPRRVTEAPRRGEANRAHVGFRFCFFAVPS